MIFLSVIISIIIISFTLIFFLKKKDKSFVLPNWLLILSVFSLLVGLVLIIWQENEINNELVKRNWPNAEGKIIESEIIGERALRAEIKFKYLVHDSIYFGISDFNIPGFGSKNYRRKNARIIKNDNPVGSKIVVYFDPNNPEVSTLRYGPYWSNYMIIGFGSVLLFLGMFIIKWKLFTKIKTKEK